LLYIRLIYYICDMKTFQEKGFEFFWDKNQKLWVLYPIDKDMNRIEWDINDNPIECLYFNNRNELNVFLKCQ
jgi:hypothetical protein